MPSRFVIGAVIVTLLGGIAWILRLAEHASDTRDQGMVATASDPRIPGVSTPDVSANDAPNSERKASEQHLRVVARQGDAPASDARISVLKWSNGAAAVVDSYRGVANHVQVIVRDQPADADGSVKLVVNSLPLLIVATADGCQPTATIVEQATEEVFLDLEADAPVQVRVVDERNAPIPGASIVGREDSFNSKFVRDTASVARRAARAFFESKTTTDADGKAIVRGLGQGSLFVEASAPGRGSSSVGFIELPTMDTIELVLGQEAIVSGVVVDAATEAPMPGVRLSIDRFRGAEIVGSSVPVFSDERGEFRIAAVGGAGANFLFPILDGRTCDVVNLGAIEIGETRFVNVRIEEARAFRGRVVDTAKQPIAGAGVWLGPIEPRIALGRIDAEADGTFEFRHSSRDGSFRIISIAPGYGLFETQVDPPWPKDFTIVLQSLGGVRGRIVAESYPLVNAKVRVATESAASYRWASQVVDANPETGEFEVQGLWPGTHFLDALVDGYSPRRVHAVEIREGKTAEHDVRIDRGATIHGIVRDRATGAPIANATLRLIDPSENSKDLTHSFSRNVQTDATGNYRFENVPRALRTGFFVEAEGYARGTTIFDLDPAASGLRRDVELAKPAQVRVRATRPDGAPARSLSVWFESIDGGSTEVTCDDGTVEIENLAPGRTEFVCILTDLDRPEFCGLQRAQSFEVSSETEDLHFDFHSGSTVVARLVGSPEFLAGKYFYLSARRLDTDPPISLSQVARQSENRYAVYGLEPGRWVLRLATSLLGSKIGAEREITVEAGQTYELDFPVGSATVEGVVRDRQGQPVEGAEISLRTRADPVARENGEIVDNWHRDVSKPDGAFRVEGLFPGAQEFAVQARGFGRLEGEILELALDSPNTHDFVLEADCTVRVAVVDIAGNRVESAKIEIRRVGSSGEPFAPSEIDSRDRAIVHGTSTGAHTLSVRGEGFFPFESRISCVAGEDITVTATLRRPATLAIKLKDTQGNLLRDTPLEFVDSSTMQSIASWLETGLITTSTGSLVTDEHGELHVVGVPEGSYELRCLGVVRTITTGSSDSEPQLVIVAH